MESGPVYVDAKTVAVAGTPEALTTREIRCTTVTIMAKSGNGGVVYICDSVTAAKKFPASGLAAGTFISLPCSDPAAIEIDVSVGAEGVDWIAM